MKSRSKLTFGFEEMAVDPAVEPDPVFIEDAATLFDDMKARHDVVVSVESVSAMLRTEPTERISKATLRMVNMTCNACLSNIKMDMQELPVSLADYDRTPSLVIEKGAEKVDEEKHRVLDTLREPLGQLLKMNADSRKVFNSKLDTLKQRVATIQACLDRGMTTDESAVIYLKDAGDAAPRLLYPEGFVQNGATAMHDLTYFLIEHEHMFKRLVKKQSAWIVDHADNLAKTSRPLAQYSFDPSEYRCCDAAYYLGERRSDGDSVFKTKPLPGLKAMAFKARSSRVFGAEAIEALEAASVKMLDCDPTVVKNANEFWNNPELGKLPNLTTAEVKARLEEAKRALDHLAHWGDMTYIELWKSACFEAVLMEGVLKPDALSLAQRMMTDLARATMRQLFQATVDVADYAFETIDAMFGLIEYCLEKTA